MQLKLALRKYVLVLLAIFLIFQITPSAYVSVDFLDDNTHEPFTVFSANTAQTDIYLLNTENRKTSFQITSTELYDSFLDCLYFMHISESKSLYCQVPSDSRKEIIKAILHYFHGSKYKDINLVI